MDNKKKETELDRILAEIKKSDGEDTAARDKEEEAASAPDPDPEQSAAAPAPEKKDKKKDSLLADLAALLLRVGWIALVLAILLLVICGVTVTNGNSMAPAFHDHDVVIYYRLAKDIQAGEVVAYRGRNDQTLLGRVVAKGGDTVDIDEGGLRINGYYQSEPYKTGDTIKFEGGIAFPVTLRPGEYFVLCDDRSQSSDSRILGPVSGDRILGRVMLTIRQRDF